MRMNRKGDIGFMEAMAGAMAVCVAMIAFVAFVSADVVDSQQKDIEFDWSYIQDISVEEGKVRINFSSDPVTFMESNGLTGIFIKTVTSKNSDVTGTEYGFGTDENLHSIERKLFSVKNGQETIPVSVEVRLCK